MISDCALLPCGARAWVPRGLAPPPAHTRPLDCWLYSQGRWGQRARRRTSQLRVERNSWAGGVLEAPGCRGAHVGTQKSSRGAPWFAVRVAAVVGVGLSQLRAGAADLAGVLPAPRLNCSHLCAGALKCPRHRARGGRGCCLPSPQPANRRSGRAPALRCLSDGVHLWGHGEARADPGPRPSHRPQIQR